jgi:hypothetical protein
VLKEISPAYQVFTNGTMSGTNVLTSLATGVQFKDSVGYQFQWTGQPSGTFAIQTSADYNPGLPGSGGAYNAGIWNAYTLSPIPSASGSGSYVATVEISQCSLPWIRAQYTNSTGSGVLTGYVFAKSLG